MGAIPVRRHATILALAAALLLSAAAAAACQPPPRLYALEPRAPAVARPWPPACLDGYAWPPQDCEAPGMLEAYRRDARSYLAALERFAAEARRYADEAARFARQAQAYADCEARDLALR